MLIILIVHESWDVVFFSPYYHYYTLALADCQTGARVEGGEAAAVALWRLRTKISDDGHRLADTEAFLQEDDSVLASSRPR